MSEAINVEVAGPWASLQAVSEYLHLSEDEVEAKVNRRELLACKFRDGHLYFPTRQLVNGSIVKGLPEVLDALARGIDSPQVWSTWMAGTLEGGTSAWEQLRAGRVEGVLSEVSRDADRWAR